MKTEQFILISLVLGIGLGAISHAGNVGHMIYSSAAAPGQMDNAVVYPGDYQPEAFSKATAVEAAGKLAMAWGEIKESLD